MDSTALGPIEAAVLQSAAKVAAERFLNAIPKLRKRSEKNGALERFSEERIAAHAQKVSSWASSYTFVGLGSPKNSATTTMALRFNSAPRRFRHRGSHSEATELGETELISDAQKILILGEPGSGKTTTLRRLAVNVLHQGATSDRDDRSFVILIILRELPVKKFLCEAVADILGLEYTKTKLTEGEPSTSAIESRENYRIEIESQRAEKAIATICDEISAVILIDGLDEVPTLRRLSIEKEIEELGLLTQNTGIITSCRSGDFVASLQGFRVIEIAPLNDAEIEGIASLWLNNPEPFLAALSATPYRDIVDRPLLLSFLLFLYSAEGRLPDRPSSIYRKVVYRLLREWDEERRIERSSNYANFDPDQKIDFLSEIAYELTYHSKSKIFSEEIFKEIYERIRKIYGLPASAYRQVATEIQTHTGIISACSLDSFEFSHLSIQEFLCANYIVRTPSPAKLKDYFTQYPAPIAVACALSSNPSLFISEMIFRHLTERLQNWLDPLCAEQDALQLTLFGADSEVMLKSFLDRLRMENPIFREDKQLGEAILCLFAFYYHRYSKEVDSLLCWLLEIEAVHNSTSLALSCIDHKPFVIRGSAVGFTIDNWFAKTFRSFFGAWEEKGASALRLPVVVMPKQELERVYTSGKFEIKIAKSVPESISPRVRKTLRSTPFCILEAGGHRWNSPSAEATCDYCGATRRSVRPIRTKRAT